MSNFNIFPYYDDFDASKNFQKILFVPGRAIQSRELTQIQSAIQSQIASIGNYLFKNGTVVIPGHVFYDNNAQYVRLESSYGGVLTDDILDGLVGSTVTGDSSGVAGKIVAVRKSTSTDQPVIFVKYTRANGNKTKFDVEELTCSAITAKLKIDNVSNYYGTGAICSVSEGVFYVNGFFVQCLAQRIALSLDSTPSCRVGLQVTESIVTAEDDESLYDASEGFVNKTMQGADRFKISLTLATRGLYVEDQDTADQVEFVDLLHVSNGQIQYKLETAKLGEIEKNLAKRTYDESGDYIVEPFNFSAAEYRNNNRGLWSASKPYLEGDIVTSNGLKFVATTSGYSGAIAPVLTSDTDAEASDGGVTWVVTSNPQYNYGKHYSSGDTVEEHKADEAKAVLSYSSGTMYIHGFEVNADGYNEIVIDKARASVEKNNASIVPEAGNFVRVKNLSGLPDVKTCPLADLRDASGTVIGNARIRGLEFVSNGVFKLYLIAVSTVPFRSFGEVAKIRVANPSLTSTHALFECDIDPSFKQIEGTVAVSGTTLTGSGTALAKYGMTRRNFRVGNVPSTATSFKFTTGTDTTGTTSVDLGTIQANTPIWIEQAVLEGKKSLLLGLPHEYVKTLRANATVDTTYTVRRVATQSWATGGATVGPVITLTTENEDLLPAASGNYYISVASHANGAASTVYPLSGALSISNENKTLTIDMSHAELTGITTSAGGITYSIYFSVLKKNNGAIEKNKQIKRKSALMDTYTKANTDLLYLGEADVTRIISVSLSGGAEFDSTTPTAVVDYQAAGQEDITSRYTLFNGQNDGYYGGAYIKLKDGATAPSAPVKVVFEYFDHGVGDFFSVDSYTDTAYQLIPASLRDCIDLRPRMADDNSGFTGTGASQCDFISPSSFMVFDYAYYLGRNDVVVCDATTQQISVVRGASSLDPQFPTALSSSQVVIGQLEIAPYTVTANSKYVKYTAKRMDRYTMEDIGKIAQRLENVEEYVALSLLEKETQDMVITDKFGNDRYKNGFLADSFRDHTSGYYNNPDYCGAVKDGTFVPMVVVDSINMIEESSSARRSRHYAVTGDLVTLPYTNVIAIEQRAATRPEYVNPFAVFTFNGRMNVFPQEDRWFEYIDLPDINQIIAGNFATVSATAQAAGILGTTYGAWKSTSVTTSNWATATTTTTSTRSVATTAVAEQIVRQSSSTKIVSQTLLPWARQRTLQVAVEGLMPNTDFFFWARSNTLSFTPATVLTITKTNDVDFIGAKDSELMNDNLAARRVGGVDKSYNVLQRGEVLMDNNNNTAIVLAEEVVAGGVVKLYVANVKGTLSGAVRGITSKATANITGTVAGSNQSNINGSLYGLVEIPTRAFRTDSQIRIVANNSETNDSTEIRSRASADFVSRGYRAERQQTIVSVRNGVVRTTNSTETKTTVTTTQIDWGDPLAETFLVTDPNGVMLTGLDLFFYSKEANKSVTVEIHTVDNGYPTQECLPFATSTKQANRINVSTNSLVATHFDFESPVYIAPNTEYAIVVVSDSDTTRVWTSRMGENDITTGLKVNTQPYLGSMFKSQNSSTWTAEQNDDLTFVLYKARFDISTAGVPVFANQELSLDNLELNPLTFTAGSRQIIVKHVNHGLKTGDRVTLSGIAGLPTVMNTAWGTTSGLSNINGTYSVTEVRFDRYVITLPTSKDVAPISGNFGRAGVLATKNYQVNEIELDFNYSLPPTTEIYSGFRGWAYDWPITAQWESGLIMAAPRTQVQVNRQMQILSRVNELLLSNGKKTLLTKIQLVSSDENVSPVIDMSSMATNVVTYLINTPTVSTLNIAGLNETTVFTGQSVTFDTDGFYTTNTALFDEFDRIDIGKYIIIDGAVSNHDQTVLVTAKENYFSDTDGTRNKVKIIVSTTTPFTTGADTISVVKRNGFVSEASPSDSSSYMKYIMSPMFLDKPATGFKIRMAYSMVSGAGIAVWYKTASKSNLEELDSLAWKQITLTGTEQFVNTPNKETFFDFEIDRDDLTEFDAVCVKVVGTGNAGYNYPVFKDFRFIALA